VVLCVKFGYERPIHHVGSVLGVDGLRPFRGSSFVERLLVFGAGFAIDCDHERRVSERQHVLLEMFDDNPATFVTRSPATLSSSSSTRHTGRSPRIPARYEKTTKLPILRRPRRLAQIRQRA
jgi:hypothetical protein